MGLQPADRKAFADVEAPRAVAPKLANLNAAIEDEDRLPGFAAAANEVCAREKARGGCACVGVVERTCSEVGDGGCATYTIPPILHQAIAVVQSAVADMHEQRERSVALCEELGVSLRTRTGADAALHDALLFERRAKDEALVEVERLYADVRKLEVRS